MLLTRWLGAPLFLLVAACSRQPHPTSEGLAETTKTAETPTPLVAASQVDTCTVRHACSLSHPGLGSHSRTTVVELATCTRTSSSTSGPWNEGRGVVSPIDPSVPGAAPSAQGKVAAPPKPTRVPVEPAECARIKSLVGSVTAADRKAAVESAQIDSEACSLVVACGTPPAPLIDVQRQSLTGSGPVPDLIRAVYGQR
jgi:hypothetical protein